MRKMAAQKMVWDGHSGTKEKVSQTARDNITTEDKMNVIKHKIALVARRLGCGLKFIVCKVSN